MATWSEHLTLRIEPSEPHAPIRVCLDDDGDVLIVQCNGQQQDQQSVLLDPESARLLVKAIRKLVGDR
jgi:hypothetical protein